MKALQRLFCEDIRVMDEEIKRLIFCSNFNNIAYFKMFNKLTNDRYKDIGYYRELHPGKPVKKVLFRDLNGKLSRL